MSDCHDAMVFMPNLHEIHLEKALITTNFLRSLTKLFALRKLSLDQAELDIDFKYLRHFITPQLDTLQFGQSIYISQMKKLLPYIDLKDMRHFKAPHCSFVTTVPRWQGPLTLALESLELLEVDDMDALKRVLANTPQLKKLHIISGSDSEDFDNLLLPKLEILQAPASTCKNLVPGRPISSLTISWRPGTRYTSLRGHDADTFCLSTQTLRHLGVPLHF